jgi:hypothetical protein
MCMNVTTQQQPRFHCKGAFHACDVTMDEAVEIIRFSRTQQQEANHDGLNFAPQFLRTILSTSMLDSFVMPFLMR